MSNRPGVRRAARALPLALMVAAAAVVTDARAVEVTPFSFDLEPSGRAATRVVRVSNASSELVAIEVAVKRRMIDEHGVDRFVDAPEAIAVFPPQSVAPAGGAASFRVRYTGDANLATSQDYVVFFNQTALNQARGASGVTVVMSFGAAVHVVPRGARAQLRVTDLQRGPAGALSVSLVNFGSKYARIGDAAWVITCGGGQTRLDRDDLRRLAPAPLVLPGARRVVRMPEPAQCRGASEVTASISPDQ